MIGERLKYYRNQRGMTQEEVAEKMAVDTGVIDCWEKNILAPTPKELVSIVKILGVTAGKILDKNIVSEKDEDVLPKEQYYFEHVIGDEEKIRKEDASRYVKRVGIFGFNPDFLRDCTYNRRIGRAVLMFIRTFCSVNKNAYCTSFL